MTPKASAVIAPSGSQRPRGMEAIVRSPVIVRARAAVWVLFFAGAFSAERTAPSGRGAASETAAPSEGAVPSARPVASGRLRRRSHISQPKPPASR